MPLVLQVSTKLRSYLLHFLYYTLLVSPSLVIVSYQYNNLFDIIDSHCKFQPFYPIFLEFLEIFRI